MAILREQAEALIREQITNTIFQDVPKQSIVMQLGTKLPNMTSKQTRVPVLSMLPMSYWVNGDTGFKETTQMEWENVYLTAGELAVIVPIPEAVVEDASFDILGEITPRVNEAIAMRFDSAVIFGVNRPSEWQNDIITMARQAGNNIAASSGINYDILMGENGLLAKVEESGYTVNGVVAAMQTRSALRGIKDTSNRPIFVTDMQGATRYGLDGAPMYFPENGSFDTSIARMVAGNWSQLVYSIRQDVTTKILDQGVIQDPTTKEIVYNLAQQDMIALRVVMRVGWALPNPATRMNPDQLKVPFAYIEPERAVTTQTVTFTAKDDGSSAIENAVVNVNGSKIKTDTSGNAVFNLRAGSYPYTVKKTGYRTVSGEAVVDSSAVPVSITLPEIK